MQSMESNNNIEDKIISFVNKLEKKHKLDFTEINIVKKTEIGFGKKTEIKVNYYTK
jgi:hypothetical protein